MTLTQDIIDKYYPIIKDFLDRDTGEYIDDDIELVNYSQENIDITPECLTILLEKYFVDDDGNWDYNGSDFFIDYYEVKGKPNLRLSIIVNSYDFHISLYKILEEEK